MCDCENVLRYCTHNDEAVKASDLGFIRPAPIVQASGIVDEFRFALNDLSDVVEQLRIRALPVSQPEYVAPEDGMDTPPISDARCQLFRLHALTGDLRGIIDRLEV